MLSLDPKQAEGIYLGVCKEPAGCLVRMGGHAVYRITIRYNTYCSYVRLINSDWLMVRMMIPFLPQALWLE